MDRAPPPLGKIATYFPIMFVMGLFVLLTVLTALNSVFRS